MKFIKFSLFLSILFLLQGCVTPTTINKSSYKTKNLHDNTNLNKANSTKSTKNLVYSGNIKGIATLIKYEKSKKSWLYEIKGVDMSNHKLPYARFYHHNKLAQKGDLVYVILKNSELQYLFLLGKNNGARYSEHKSSPKNVINKRDKLRINNNISLPQVQKVEF